MYTSLCVHTDIVHSLFFSGDMPSLSLSLSLPIAALSPKSSLTGVFAIEQVWDLRKNDVVSRMRGHSDTVTGMKLSPDGSYLLTNAMDNTSKWHEERYMLFC